MEEGGERNTRASVKTGRGMADSNESILIFTGGEAEGEARRRLREVAQKASGTISEIAVSTLQENMHKFLRSLSTILSVPPEEVGGGALDTVEVSAQLDGKGNIGLRGVGTAELAAHGGIKLVLKKKG